MKRILTSIKRAVSHKTTKQVVLLLLIVVVASVAVFPGQARAAGLSLFGPTGVLADAAIAGLKAMGFDTSGVESGASMFSNAIINSILRPIGLAVMTLSAMVVWLAGKTLDMAMYYTAHMKEITDSVSIIAVGWGLFRDLANMVFIFILLYIAIATILNLGNARKMLVDVIVTALFINFSLFITQVIVDTTNIVSIYYYDQMQGITSVIEPNTINVAKGPSAVFMDMLKMNTLYSYDGVDLTTQAATLGLFKSFGELVQDPVKTFSMLFLGSVIMLIAAFVFATGALLLILRIVVLMFLMMVSPVAFVARLLPRSQAIWNKWWDSLINNAIYAPVYFVMTFVILKTLQNGINLPNLNLSSASFSTAFAGNGGSLGILFNYVFIIILLVMTIFMAKSISVHGANMVTGWANSAGNWMRARGRQFGGYAFSRTVGEAARRFERKAETTSAGTSWLGARIRSFTTTPIASTKYGGAMSAEERHKWEKGRITESEEAGRIQALMTEADKGDQADPRKLEDLALRMAPAAIARLDAKYLKKLPIGMLPDAHWQAIMASDKVQSDKDEFTKMRLKPMQVVMDKIRSENLAGAVLQQHPEIEKAYFDAGGLKLFLKKEKGETLSADEQTAYDLLSRAGVSWTQEKDDQFKPAFEFARAKSVKELGQLNRVDPDTINELTQILNWSQINPLRKSEDLTFEQRNGQDGAQLRDFKDRTLLDAIDIRYGIALAEEKNGKLVLRSLKDRYQDRLKLERVYQKVRKYGEAAVENTADTRFDATERTLWGQLKAAARDEWRREMSEKIFERHHEGRSDSELTMGRTYVRNEPTNLASMGSGSVPYLIDRDNDKKEFMAEQLLTSIAEDTVTEQNKGFIAKVFWDRDADKFLKNWEEIAERCGYKDNQIVKKVLEWKKEGTSGKEKFMKHIKTIRHKDFYAGSTVKGETDWATILSGREQPEDQHEEGEGEAGGI